MPRVATPAKKAPVAKRAGQRIFVYADWSWLRSRPTLMGILHATTVRGGEVFAFEYSPEWLRGGIAQSLDPQLSFYEGRQIAYSAAPNFGAFLDSSPDRWGRTVMQ